MGTSSLHHTNTSHPISSIIKQFPKPSQIRHFHQSRTPISAYKGLQQRQASSSVNVPAIGCMARDSSGLLTEMKPTEEEEEELEEWMRERCRDKKETVEVLECLENEAIMGEDHGREPVDYSRRAQIFSKSSRVFQALKSRQS